MQQSTYSKCLFACNATHIPVFNEKCNDCVNKAPLSKDLCIHACENSYNKQLTRICKKCASPPVEDKLCMYACGRSHNNEGLQQICGKCFAPPLQLTNSTCQTQCSSFANSRFQNICNQCIDKHPCSVKLCMYVCVSLQTCS